MKHLHTLHGQQQTEAHFVRVPAARGVGTRVELVALTVQLNPYLTLAVCLAAGLDGIKRKLTPKESVQKDIFSMTDAEREEAGIKNLPKNLYEAVREMKKSFIYERGFRKRNKNKYVYAKKPNGWNIHLRLQIGKLTDI